MVTETAFQSAFDEHKDAVYRFAWRMAGPDAAEDPILVNRLNDQVRTQIQRMLQGLLEHRKSVWKG